MFCCQGSEEIYLIYRDISCRRKNVTYLKKKKVQLKDAKKHTKSHKTRFRNSGTCSAEKEKIRGKSSSSKTKNILVLLVVQKEKKEGRCKVQKKSACVAPCIYNTCTRATYTTCRERERERENKEHAIIIGEQSTSTRYIISLWLLFLFLLLLLFSSHEPIGPQPYPVIYMVANPVRDLLNRKISEEHHLQSSNNWQAMS